jgi:tRNA A37 N6-isopentenylltransferase MiaA
MGLVIDSLFFIFKYTKRINERDPRKTVIRLDIVKLNGQRLKYIKNKVKKSKEIENYFLINLAFG